MSKVKDLIKELCPNGVKYITLDKVCKINKGSQLNKETLLEHGYYPVINGGINPSGYWNEYNFEDNLITISQGGASAGHVNFQKTKFWAGAHCYVVENIDEKINYKYLYHFLKKKQDYLQKSQVGAGIPSISLKEIYSLLIPIPPIEVQEEIVKILDKFGELEAELETELKVRRSQYEFWRGKLVDGNYEEYRLKDLLTIRNGRDYKHLCEGNIPVYGSGGIMTYVDNYVYDKPSVLIPRKGSLGNVFYVDRPFWNVDTIYYTEIDESNVIPKYIYYFIKNEHLEKLNIAGGVPSMTQSTLNKILVKVPPIEEQERLVNILDKFDTLVNDISSGIPAEIELRRKQYEYYRNKLLSFEELSSNE